MSTILPRTLGSAWYRICVPRFQDSNGDGFGDLAGVIRHIDYLADELGVSAIILSPIFATTLVGGTFDTVDYLAVEPRFGAVTDLTELCSKLHDRDISLVLEYCPEFTSDQHQWFMAERQAPPADDDLYVWKLNPEDSSDWFLDDMRKQYYKCAGSAGRPLLRADNHRLFKLWPDVFAHWQSLGVDGFWSSADHSVTYVDGFRHSRRLSLLGNLSGGALKTLVEESLATETDDNTGTRISVQEGSIGSRAIALGADRRSLIALLQMTLRGTPEIEYGDELDLAHEEKIMPWNSSEAAGFTEGVPWRAVLPDGYRRSVALQQANPESSLSFYAHLLNLRRFSPALLEGDYHSVAVADEDVYIFVRETELQRFLIVANCSGQKKSITISSRAGAWVAGTHLVLGDGEVPVPGPVSLAPYEGRVYEAARNMAPRGQAELVL